MSKGEYLMIIPNMELNAGHVRTAECFDN